jgi:hypothetical protein
VRIPQIKDIAAFAVKSQIVAALKELPVTKPVFILAYSHHVNRARMSYTPGIRTKSRRINPSCVAY